MKWSSIWYINKLFISITILKTNIQNERPLHGEYPLWIKCSRWPSLLSSKREKWNCHLSFYNLHDQLLPSIYPWLQNRCLAINNSSLLVSMDMSYVPIALQRPGWNIHISSRYFSPLGRMPHFSLLIRFLILIQSGKRGKWNYTIHRKIVMPEHTYIHTFTLYRFIMRNATSPGPFGFTPHVYKTL
jgi:hypothetical protein